jgi:formamidase
MASLIRGGPHFEGGSQTKKLQPDQFYATVGYPLKKAGEVPPQHKYLDSAKLAGLSNLNEDLTQAARNSLIDMIEWLTKTKGFTAQQAYAFTSVACDLRIGNVVDVPNYAVSTICPLEVFQK